MRIVFTGGGTGGHFFPILATIRELKRIAEEEHILDLELFYIGPDDFGVDLLKEEQVASLVIPSGKMRTYASAANVFDIFTLAVGSLRALWNMFLIMPDVVFSKGGYGALPTVLAAILFRIPLILHESDAVPGKVNRFAARFAARIGIAFTNVAGHFPKGKIAQVGIPIRKRILGGNREEAKESLNIFSPQPVVGIIGASQGAQKINEAILEILKDLTDEYEVVHQTGAKHYDNVVAEAKAIVEFAHKDRYHPIGFMSEVQMRDFYMASDLVVSRAGASSIFEIAAWGKPSVLLPLRIAAQDHQRKNAYEYAAGGGATVIEEDNLTPHILLAEIRKILGNPDLRKKMSEAAQRFARIDSAEVIAREILNLGVH